ncbi:MAG: DUF177 domain-containing protein [Bdellovibrionales bacterium]|nr:DUF177 domain-containing protein [Bdellovibrionales bacterium]
MIIRLNEINDDGEDFDLSSADEELREGLSDILKGQVFTAKMRIVPAGDAFDVQGNFTAKIPETCSLCADDIQLPLKERFHEILLIGTKNKTELKGSSEDFEDPDLNATHIKNFEFNVTDFLREQFLLAMPTQPKCSEDCKGLCLICREDRNVTDCGHNPLEIPKKTAFSVLKDLKLN